jgi:hypothetical protein
MVKISDSSSTTIAVKTASFHKSYEILVNDSDLLTQTYQKEIRKWQLKQYDNDTMISITCSYCQSFKN